jgi:hypothetical protein
MGTIQKVRRALAGIVGGVLPEDIRAEPEKLGLLSPGTVDTVLAPAGVSLNEMASSAKRVGRQWIASGRKDEAAALKALAESQDRIQDGTEIVNAADLVKVATGAKRK